MSLSVSALRDAYDAELREAAELVGAEDVVRHGPLWWGRFGDQGFCTYRDLGDADVDAAIAATVAHFRDGAAVGAFEWKTRGHDVPADLPARLEAHGLVPEEEETVMIGEAHLLAVEVAVPSGVVLRRAGEGGALADDLRRASAMQAVVFGTSRGTDPEALPPELVARPDLGGLWLAEVAGEVVGTGRLTRVAGTAFAGLWGGAMLASWRGRGIYRALTAARARAALALGVRYLHSDAGPMSRPVLERAGLARITTTTPYVWSRE